MIEEQSKEDSVHKLDKLSDDLTLYSKFQLVPVYAALIVSIANSKIDLSKGLDFPSITLIVCLVSYVFILIQRLIIRMTGDKIFKSQFNNNIFEVMDYDDEEEG